VIGALVWSVPAAAEHLFHGTGHGTASLGHAMRATGQMVMAATSVGSAIGSAGSSMMSATPSGGGGARGSLPPPSASAGGGASAASGAGARMAPQGARFTRSP
jgi:hypothetical protein